MFLSLTSPCNSITTDAHGNTVASSSTPASASRDPGGTGLASELIGARQSDKAARPFSNTKPADDVDGLNLDAYAGARVTKPVDRSGLAEVNPGDTVKQRLPVVLEKGRFPYEHLREQFQEGDIVYGLAARRHDAIVEIATSGFGFFGDATPQQRLISRELRPDGPPLTKVCNILSQNHITDAVWNYDNPRAYAKKIDMFLRTSDYQRVLDFKSFTKQNKKFDVKYLPLDAGGEHRKNFIWKRLSKAGLLFQIEERRRTVHFILADVDFKRVVDKEVNSVSGESLITSAELRFLYRLKDLPAMQQHVVFHCGDGIVPHAEFISLMSGYQPRSFASAR